MFFSRLIIFSLAESVKLVFFNRDICHHQSSLEIRVRIIPEICDRWRLQNIQVVLTRPLQKINKALRLFERRG
ncbi:protein of unknown function [Xenorhabdus poinarii G6]|uniref:Uncharacterized protein n=1 Tax=Xenorhabdus poinarii G6 TaxID=1354304 RepID=A0A068R1E8_9GAMM|nr:protein of unknown function [Xenorhabdus poinarii G6]